MAGFSPNKELTQNKLYVQVQVHPPLVLIIQRQPKWEGQEGSATFPLSLWQPPPPRPRLDPATHRAGSGSERLAPGPRQPLLHPGGKPELLARDWRTDHQFMTLSHEKKKLVCI